MKLELKVKKLHKNAKLPAYALPSDAGADLFCLNEETIEPGENKLISTGIAFELPHGYVALIWDKSGVSLKKHLKVFGGVVDAGYRGEIMVTLHNAGKTVQAFAAGDKIAQLLIQKVEQPSIVESTVLTDSVRGDRKHGSTGR